MSAILAILRAGPLTTIQDEGRLGLLRHGISASGPMDATAFGQAGQGGHGGIEFTRAGIEFRVASGSCRVGFAGGNFLLTINGSAAAWPGDAQLAAGDRVSVTPGHVGNYGYLRFDTDLALKPVLGSIATSTRAQLGGVDGRVLKVGDVLELGERGTALHFEGRAESTEGPFHIIWGLHADIFGAVVRDHFISAKFTVSMRMDRMGVRLDDLEGVFRQARSLSLVSDAIIPGDIQILGDGTPIVLMRDHQPTGGYPRIATIIGADLDRFSQVRPGGAVVFSPVTVEHAQRLLRGC